MSRQQITDRSYSLPPLGDNPSTQRQGTTPGFGVAQKSHASPLPSASLSVCSAFGPFGQSS